VDRTVDVRTGPWEALVPEDTSCRCLVERHRRSVILLEFPNGHNAEAVRKAMTKRILTLPRRFGVREAAYTSAKANDVIVTCPECPAASSPVTLRSRTAHSPFGSRPLSRKARSAEAPWCSGRLSDRPRLPRCCCRTRWTASYPCLWSDRAGPRACRCQRW
jgi:hypothetical protein